MLSRIPKSTILRKKGPNKLSLKKNVRRSSILYKRVIPLKNASLIDKSTSSGTVSLFSSSDDDILDVSVEDKQTKCSGPKNIASEVIEESGSDVLFSSIKSNNLSSEVLNPHDEEKCNFNSMKNESDILTISPISGKQSLILIPSISIDNSINSLFSSFNEKEVSHIAFSEKEENRINSERKEEVSNSVILVSSTDNDLLEDSYDQLDRNQHIEILDKLYGTEWRKAEKLVFSEPRPNRPLKTKISAPKTDIKPFKSVTNIFPKEKKKANKPPVIKNLQNYYDDDTSERNSKEELKTVKTKLFPKVLRKPIKSPWIERLQNLCDSDTSDDESGKENKRNYFSNKIKNKLNYDNSSASSYDSSSATSTDEPCNSNSFLETNKQKVKPKLIKKLENREVLHDEKIQSDPGATANIFDNKKLTFSTPKLKSRIKCIPSLNTSEIIHKSFLESLSANVPLNQCDPSARIFRNCYQTYKVQLTERLFKLFNEKIFNNVIPEDTSIVWNVKLTRTAGYCKQKRIKASGRIEKTLEISLSVKVLDSAERLRCTLVHEMIHAVCMITGTHDKHGPNFKAWARKANGIFPELPPITRCHSYDIRAKYTYKCFSCGFCINRHSKSINLTKKVCGRCHGKFELLLNKTAKGEKKSVPVTPKTPSGFALFVKDNYAQCRTPELKHAEVMKLLGSKFTELKLSVGK